MEKIVMDSKFTSVVLINLLLISSVSFMTALTVPVVAGASVIFEEDFNDLADGNLAGQAGWIDNTLRGSGGLTVSSELPYEGAKGIVSPTTGPFGAQYRAYHEISPVQRGRASVYMRVTGDAWESFWLTEGKAPEDGREVGAGAMRLYVFLDGQTDQLRFGTSPIVPPALIVPAASETWYKVTVGWDVSSTTQKAWVNDEYKGEFTVDQPIQNYIDGIMLDVPDHIGGLKVYFDAITVTTVSAVVQATIDIDPDTLNLKSEGLWITAYIELPENYNPNDIDISTVELSGQISAELDPTEIGDHDTDGILDLMVKFDRADLMALLSVGEATLTVTGTVNETPFEGTDTIIVIGK